MKNVIKNRSQRRGTFKKPQLRLNGFRPGHKSSKLLRKYVNECTSNRNGEVGEWILKNISSPKDVIGWNPEMRGWVHKLLNQDKLIEELDLKLNEDTTINDGIPTYIPKNDKPQKLIQFIEYLTKVISSEMGIEPTGIGTHPYDERGFSQVCSLTGNSFFIRKYGNKLQFQSEELEFSISNLKDGVEIHNIEVKSKGNGIGTKFLEGLTFVSEITDYPVYLVPIDFKGIMGGNGKLSKWYQKNGFKKTNTPYLSYQPTGEFKTNLFEVPNEVLEKFRMVG